MYDSGKSTQNTVETMPLSPPLSPRQTTLAIWTLIVCVSFQNQNVVPIVQAENSSEYSKYPHYPTYCSTPEQMDMRKIPPLPQKSKAGETRLLQVTAVIRHGARTPWNVPSSTQNVSCWKGYNPKWDCDLTTWLGTPPRDYHNGNVDSQGGMFLMNKEYTALNEPQHNLTNLWGGTCQRGQLLLRGYDQELKNGQFLRDAYVYHGDNDYGHNERMRLLDATTILNDPSTLESNLYYRSDDDQRTLMSGQVLLRGLLQDELNQYFDKNKKHPVLPLRVADRERDVLDANMKICPRLPEIEDRYFKSKEYQNFLESSERKLLLDFQENVLGAGDKAEMIDCLMTTICADRELPSAINDYQGEDMGGGNYYNSSSLEGDLVGNVTNKDYGHHLFQRLGQLGARASNLLHLADGGEFSKVSFGPLWKEMMHHIRAAYTTSSSIDSGDEQGPPPAKLALFSGHDTTIMPLLASIGAWEMEDWWPPYASTMIIEVHELNFDGSTDMTIYPTNYAFRLLYNGQVWTSRIDGCPPEPEHLCDLDILLHLVTPLVDRDCSLKYPAPQAYSDPVQQAQEILKTQGGQWAMGAVALSSFVAGILFTTMLVCCCCSSSTSTGRGLVKRRRRRDHLVPTDDEQDGIVMGDLPGQGYRDDNQEDNGEPELEPAADLNENGFMAA